MFDDAHGVAQVLPGIPEKRYFKIGEVCAITGVKQHVLRYWESEFRILHPQRAQSKQRLYRRVDVETVLAIKRLLKDEGFTISGAKKALAKDGGGQEQEPAVNPADIFGQLKAELLALQKILEE
ncbi:MAG TPA: MerR family transcriptional regulator [Deltaproteobacteria bacterium]|nr:MerR family transcriptional regulator [Deltaproteobacteria bacterium]